MSRINDGGPAFPFEGGDNNNRNPSYGMRLRDYFAAKAMQGMLAHPTRYKPRDCDQDLHWHDAIVKEAYELADAAIRTKEQ